MSGTRKHIWVVVAENEATDIETGINIGTFENGKVKYRLEIDAIGEWRDLGYKPHDVILSIVDHLNKNFSEVFK